MQGGDLSRNSESVKWVSDPYYPAQKPADPSGHPSYQMQMVFFAIFGMPVLQPVETWDLVKLVSESN